MQSFLFYFVLVFRISSLSVLCSLILSNSLTFNTSVIPFKYTNKSSALDNHKFLQVLPLLHSFTVLCIISKHLEVDDFFKVHKNLYKTVIYKDFSKTKLLESPCNVVLVIGASTYQECSKIVGGNIFANSILFINFSRSNETSHIEKCLANVSTTEVISVILEEGSVRELSPSYLLPRHFINSSVEKVLRHRVQPVKINLRGTTLSVATMNYMPFFITKNVDNISVEYDGIEKSLVQELSHQMNFSIKYLVLRRWGSLTQNGTWVGHIFGAMARKRAEIAIADIWQIPSIYSIMDFGPSLSKETFGFVVRRPKKIHIQWRTVLMIFEPRVWFATLASFVVVVIVYLCSCNLNALCYSGRKITFCLLCQGLTGSIMVVLGHMIMSSFHSLKKDGVSRHTLTLWCGFSLLFVTSLSAGIATRLTLPSYTERVDTIRQLVKDQYYWTADFYKRFRNHTAMKEFIFDFKDPWVKQYEQNYVHLRVREIHKRLYTDEKITFPVQRNGKHFVVFNTQKVARRVELQKFRLVKQSTGACHTSIGIKKNSPLYKSLYILNLMFLEFGLVDHWRSNMIRRWPEYDTGHLLVEQDMLTLEEPEQLTLYNAQSVFFLLIFGLTIATLVFLVENCWKKIKF